MSGASASRSQQDARDSGDRTRLDASSKQPRALDPGLYIVATPIGNARDITLRALDVLQTADTLACEDTRVTGKLLSIHGIQRDGLVSYHEHNAEKVRGQLIKRLKSGDIVAIVSDAGTPMINDPGFRLVQACRDAGIAVHAVPGASAVTTGLVLAGLPTDRFMYAGFPPPKSGRRRTWLGGLAGVDTTLVFLESAQRLAASLADMADVLGARNASVMREMTKKFEEVRSAALPELAAHYAVSGPPKGEVTIVVAPPLDDANIDAAQIDTLLIAAMQTERLKAAVTRVSVETGWPRRDVYNRALALKDAQSDAP